MTSACKPQLHHLHNFSLKARHLQSTQAHHSRQQHGVLRLTSCISHPKMGLDSMQVQFMRLVDFLPLPIYQSSNRNSTAISGMFSACGFKSGREERQLLKTPPFQVPLPICGLYAFLTPIGENLPHPSPQVIFRGLNSQSIKPELQGPNLIHQKQKSLKTVNSSAITTTSLNTRYTQSQPV